MSTTATLTTAIEAYLAGLKKMSDAHSRASASTGRSTCGKISLKQSA
jgi:hypothetical protein